VDLDAAPCETGMNDAKAAVDKRQYIQELWRELGRTKSSAPEYKKLVEKIRVLSAEYQALVDAAQKPKKAQE
jgi:hypothetical protein